MIAAYLKSIGKKIPSESKIVLYVKLKGLIHDVDDYNIQADNLPRVPGSSSAILDTDLGTRSAQVPRPAVAERKPLVLPQLLFPRHPARPNVLARLPPLAQGSGHASTPRLLDQGPHRTAKLAVSRPCGWRTQIPCAWLGLLKPPADLLSRQLLCARLPPAHSTPLYREEVAPRS